MAQMQSPTATRPWVSNPRFSIAPPDNVLARDRRPVSWSDGLAGPEYGPQQQTKNDAEDD